MIIVLKEADFSASKIGTIVMPEEIKQSTLDFIALYNRQLSEEKQIAVQHFLDAIGYTEQDGIYSKMEYMILPIMSTNLTDATFEIVSGERKELVNDTGASFSDGALTGVSNTLFTYADQSSLNPRECSQIAVVAGQSINNMKVLNGSTLTWFTQGGSNFGARTLVSAAFQGIWANTGSKSMVFTISETDSTVELVTNGTQVGNTVNAENFISATGETLTNRVALISNNSIYCIGATKEPLTSLESKKFNDAMDALVTALAI